VGLRGRGRVGTSPTRIGSPASRRIGSLTLRGSQCATYSWRAICNVQVARSERRTDMVHRVAAASGHTGKLSKLSWSRSMRLWIYKTRPTGECRIARILTARVNAVNKVVDGRDVPAITSPSELNTSTLRLFSRGGPAAGSIFSGYSHKSNVRTRKKAPVETLSGVVEKCVSKITCTGPHRSGPKTKRS
jgi:hypothetical protein